MPVIQVIDDALLDAVLERARTSPRLRTNHNFHEGASDNPHRFLNAMIRGTYVTPHRHRAPPKAESFLVVRGRVAVLLFDDEGRVTARHDLGGPGEPIGIDVPAGEWHSVLVLGEEAVIYEVKPGPWDPATDKELAPWAPTEDDEARHGYSRTLYAAVPP